MDIISINHGNHLICYSCPNVLQNIEIFLVIEFSMFNESTRLIVIIYTNKNCVYNGKIYSDTPKFLHVLVMVQIYIAALLAF